MYFSQRTPAGELLDEGATPLPWTGIGHSQKERVGWMVNQTRSGEMASAACCGEAQSLEVEYHEGERRRRRGLGGTEAVCE